MKFFIIISISILFTQILQGQDNKVQELVMQGVKLHDQGRYDEAIGKYKEALRIDKNSTFANYELSYTYFTIKKYNQAIHTCKMVIEQNIDYLEPAYVILGNSLDMQGKPKEAIIAYEIGLSKFPRSNLLNYNLAYTAFNSRDFIRAEQAAINAIKAKPSHASSHLVLANIMKAKDERVKAILPFYYFLMLEPNSERSSINYRSLKLLLNQGIEKKSDMNINVNILTNSIEDTLWGASEMMLGLLGATRYTEDNINKTELQFFSELNKTFFIFLGELKKNNSDFWLDFYVPCFYEIAQLNLYDAFSYYISQSASKTEANSWMLENQDKMRLLDLWLKKK